MPTALVLLPSTTYRAADFVRAAEGLGIDLVIASEQPPPFDMGDRYLQVDCSDPDRAAESITRLGDKAPLDGVVAADDAGVVIAAMAGSTLGLRANDPEAAAATRDKAKQRERMRKAEVPQPAFAVVPAGADGVELAATVGYPLVVKPLDRSAGQGVIRVDAEQHLGPALERARSIVGAEAPLIVEEYMKGDEVALEGIVRDGELTTLTIFDKPDAGEGPYFPETILLTPTRLDEETQAECRRVAAAALAAIGISHGPVHVELKVEQRMVRVIEVAARSIGGLCSRSLNFGLLGTTLEALILRNAIGMEKPELRRQPTASGVLMIPIPRSGRLVTVEGLDEVRSLAHVSAIDITATPGGLLQPPPEGDRYLGFVFARGGERDEVEAALRRAMEMIEVVVS
ncbi:MAG TPA: ATP-grasp domain-containing protein [Acidimicrobiia bacterium]|nr:ATP-grasp domain-containing protein [Acidimicrobiia bacterium]